MVMVRYALVLLGAVLCGLGLARRLPERSVASGITRPVSRAFALAFTVSGTRVPLRRGGLSPPPSGG